MSNYFQKVRSQAALIPSRWVWPVPLIIGVFCAPESPWWLVRRNRIDEAKAALTRLTSVDRVSFDLDKSITLMVMTTEHEREVETGTSYAACFKGTNTKRTIIAMGCYLAQGLCGAGFRNYSTYFYQQAGLPTVQAFNMTIVQYVLGIVGVFIAWAVLPYVGRRTLYLWGLIFIVASHFTTGGIGVAYAAHKSTALAWGAGSLLLFFTFVYDITIGPVAYALVSEVPASLLRGKTIVIARSSYLLFSIVSNVITPYMLNPSAWNWGARSGFFWAGTATIMLIFTYFMIPETMGRTFYELDRLFETKTSPRRFASTVVQVTESLENRTSSPEKV